MAYIEFQHVKKIYGKKNEAVIKALDDTNFSVEEGELAVILGASGAGKTTALNILGGMDQATEGEVIVAGKHLNKFSEKELVKYRRNDVGFVFQFYNLVPNLTALENVELAVQICKDYLDPGEVLKKVGLGGTGKETGKRHPTLKDNVMVSAGAKILGSFTIGENSKIGAGSVVLEEVPPNCTVVGVPGRVVRRENKKVPRIDMDQVHLPDPTLDDIHILQRENERLRSEIQKMSYELQDMREKEELCRRAREKAEEEHRQQLEKAKKKGEENENL